jgi:hypothetical protein
MGALTADDVTVTVLAKDFTSFGKLNLCTIKFGDGVKTYPADGIPLPVIGKFGLHKALSALQVVSKGGAKYDYDFDKAHHKLVMNYFDYNNANDGPMIEVPNTVAPAETTLTVLAYGE